MTLQRPAVLRTSSGTPHRGLFRSLAAVTLLCLALSGSVSAASAATPDGWNADAADAANSANNPGESVITANSAGRLSSAWRISQRSPSASAPVVLAGVAYHVVANNDLTNPRFAATSARTGATLWTVALPANFDYSPGLSLAGQRVIVPFNGIGGRRGGVLTLDLTTHRIAWSRSLPPTAIPWIADWQAIATYTDGTRIFVWGSSNNINTYRLTDGALLWTAPITFRPGVPKSLDSINGLDGLAVGAGFVYTGGSEGIVAYNATTGRRTWTAPAAAGTPVVAGGHVYGTGFDSVMAFPAAGCGRTTCGPQWTTRFPAQDAAFLAVGGADATTLFVTYRKDDPRDPTYTWAGVVARLSANTGRVQWSTATGLWSGRLVRGGNTIWLLNGYIDAHDNVAGRLLGFSTTATGPAPLREIDLAPSDSGVPQSLAIASGTLFQQTAATGDLIGYRIPHT